MLSFSSFIVTLVFSDFELENNLNALISLTFSFSSLLSSFAGVFRENIFDRTTVCFLVLSLKLCFLAITESISPFLLPNSSYFLCIWLSFLLLLLICIFSSLPTLTFLADCECRFELMFAFECPMVGSALLFCMSTMGLASLFTRILAVISWVRRSNLFELMPVLLLNDGLLQLGHKGSLHAHYINYNLNTHHSSLDRSMSDASVDALRKL